MKMCICIAIFLLPLNLFGWKGHPFLTRLVIEKNNIKLPDIEISPPIYDKSKIDKKECKPLLQTPMKRKVFDFILLHVVEPDCGMDNISEKSLIAKFMGGSLGMRHMYYPPGRLRFPLLFFPQGKAPERAEHFFMKAQKEFEKWNSSLGWLYLSWSLHYIEDLSQPFHTCQTSLKFVMWKKPIKGTITVTRNFHHAFEAFVYYLMREEMKGKTSFSLTDAISEPKTLPFKDIKSLAKGVARESSRLCDEIFDASFELWGKRLKRDKRVDLSEEEMRESLFHPSFKKLLKPLKEALRLLSGGIVQFFYLSDISNFR